MTTVCGTDLSPASGDALAAAAAVARARGDARLIVVHVAAAGTTDAVLEQRRTALDAAVAAASGDGLAISAELVVGETVPTLIGVAETEGADLIVVASNGHTSTSVLRLGGTSERLAVASPVPVLIVRNAAPLIAFGRGERPLRAMVAVDDSTACDIGAAWLASARRQRAIDMVVTSVYYGDVAARHYGLPTGSAVEANPEVERLLARDLVRRFGDLGGHGSVAARPARGLGRIADHLLEVAEREHVDLIVIGTSQVRGLGRFGSVSAGVVHEAPQSVLCVPPTAVAHTAVPTMRAALVATDLSEFANRAVPYAFAMVPGGVDREVHIVHVVSDEAMLSPGITEQVRQQLLSLAPAGATQTVHAHVVRGAVPATVLAQAAARFGVDVVCIASHGRSGITRALVGSVADQLLRETRVPVLVLRPKMG